MKPFWKRGIKREKKKLQMKAMEKEIDALRSEISPKDYQPYRPWEKLEKLKSAHMFDDSEGNDQNSASIQTTESLHQVQVGRKVDPSLWGYWLSRGYEE